MKAGCDSLLVTCLPNVRYLTGFSGSSGCALVTKRKKVFFTDTRYEIQAARQVRLFEVVISNGPPLRGAAEYIKSHRLRISSLGYEGAHLTCRDLAYLRRNLKGTKLSDRSGCVEEHRLVKDRKELSSIRRACRIADLSLEGLSQTRVIGKTEKQVAWMLETVMREAGSDNLPFEIIVASGPRSAMPHGVASDRVIRKDELLLVDLGASVDGYCSDMTRTFATGRLTGRQMEIYRTVQEAQDMAAKGIKAGVKASEIDKLARDRIAAAGYGEAFGHSLGHGIGLEAHEGPVLASRSKDVLAAGTTVTVEPGIYLKRAGGVRIEDTVLVTPKGAQRLTRFPRDLMKLG